MTIAAHKVKGSNAFLGREFPMSAKNFQRISSLAYDHSGIVLSDHKQQMVYSRLARVIRKSGLENFDDYLDQLDKNWASECTPFLNAITTNLTSFFRENHHFEFLSDHVVPKLKIMHKLDKRIRVWSCAASTGEEPYSIAMVLREGFPGLDWDIKILATDLDSNVLAKARSGLYSDDRVEEIEPRRLKRWFTKLDGKNYQVDDSIRSMLTFNQLNLLDSWPMKGPVDLVFCRNVIIYFDHQTQITLFKKIHNLMAEDSHLFIGHSESLFSVTTQFRSVGRTIYQRVQ